MPQEVEVVADPVKGQPTIREVVTPQAIRLQVNTSLLSVLERNRLAETLDLSLKAKASKKARRNNSHPINVRREKRIQMLLIPLAPIERKLW